jgi:HK97 family phage major capsid protein
MKETKQTSASPEARAAMHEMMAAFEAFKGANDARLNEIEKKASADTLLEEKVARIDQAVGAAQARLDRALSEARRPVIGGEPAVVASAPEAKAAFDGYVRTGRELGLELKAGLSCRPRPSGPSSDD